MTDLAPTNWFLSLFEATSRRWLPSLRLIEFITYHGGSPDMSVPIRTESIPNLIILFCSLELRKSLRWLFQIVLSVCLFLIILQVFTYAHITGVFVRSAELECHSWYVAWDVSIKRGCRFIMELKCWQNKLSTERVEWKQSYLEKLCPHSLSCPKVCGHKIYFERQCVGF